MPTYVQAAGTDTWHWCRNCNNYSSNPVKRETHPGRTRPSSGELCNTCLGKERNGDCKG